MGADTSTASPEDAGDLLADTIIKLLKKIDMPNGLRGIGYSPKDVGNLVAGTLPQHRVTKLAPIPIGEPELHHLFLESMTLW